MARIGDRARTAAVHRGVEDELAKERAERLGRSGRQLEDALAAYRAGAARPASLDGPADDADKLLDAVAARLYALVVQRESSGLLEDNLARIRAAYDVPDAAVRRMGVTRRSSRP